MRRFLFVTNFIAFSLLIILFRQLSPLTDFTHPQQIAAQTADPQSCSKLGINTAKQFEYAVPSGVFSGQSRMTLAMIASSRDIQAAIQAIAQSTDNTVVIRLGAGPGSDNFTAGQWAIILNDIATNSSVAGKHFFATAGHNEPNCAEYIPLSQERQFVHTVSTGVSASNITLITGQIDYYCGDSTKPPYTDYIASLGAIDNIKYVALPFYSGPAGGVEATITAFNAAADAAAATGRNIIITESGPLDNSMDNFLNALQVPLADSRVAGILFFNANTASVNTDSNYAYTKPFHDPSCLSALFNTCTDPQNALLACQTYNQNHENCKDYVVDPDNPLGSNIPTDCLTMNITLTQIWEYESTCTERNVNITSNGDQQVCFEAGGCAGRGTVTFSQSPQKVDLLTDENRSGAASINDDYNTKLHLKDAFDPLNTAAVYKLNTDETNFNLTKRYLTRLIECQKDFNQPGCYLPKLIKGDKDIPEDDFAFGIGGLTGLEALTTDNYTTKLSPENLKTWNQIDPHIVMLMPAFQVTSVDAPPPEEGVWGAVKTLLNITTPSPPIVRIKEFYMLIAGLTTPPAVGVSSAIVNTTSPLLPKNLIQQNQQAYTNSLQGFSPETYYNGPQIQDVGALDGVTAKLFAAKANKDNPACNLDPDPDHSNTTYHQAFAGPVESITDKPETPSSGPSVFDFFINLFNPQQPAPQAGKIKIFTYAPTYHSQNYLNQLYQIFTTADQQIKDQHAVETTTIQEGREDFQSTSVAGPTITTPADPNDPNAPQETKSVSFTAGQQNPDAPTYFKLAGPAFVNLAMLVPKKVSTIARSALNRFSCAFRGEKLADCDNTQNPTPTTPSACFFTGGPPIESTGLKDILAKASAKFNVPVQLVVAMIQGENCRTASGTRNICQQTDTFFSQNNFLSPGVEYPYSTGCGTPSSGTDAAMNGKYKGIIELFEFAHSASGWGKFRDPQYKNVCSINDAIYAIANVLADAYQQTQGARPQTPNWTRAQVDNAMVYWVTGVGGLKGCATTKDDLPQDGFRGVWDQQTRDTASGIINSIYCPYLDGYYDPNSSLYINSTCN